MNEFLSLSLLPEQDRAAAREFLEQYEKAWQDHVNRGGAVPQIETWLNQLSLAQGEVLRDDLILIELGHRKRKLGRPPSRQSLREHHPTLISHFLRCFHYLNMPDGLESGDTLRFGGTEYEIQDKLAVGGQAIAYQAVDLSLDRPVVLKISRRPVSARTPEFLHEARSLAGADANPHIVRVHRCEPYYGYVCLITDFLPGDNLAQARTKLKNNPLVAARIVATLARAVDYVHDETALIHRDIKPENVILVSQLPKVKRKKASHHKEPEPVLIDFGMARVRDSLAVGEIAGTPGYMATEQVRGRPDQVGRWTDVFGLGGVLYFLATGEPPCQQQRTDWSQQNPQRNGTTVNKALFEESGFPDPLIEIGLKCLEEDAAKRYPTADKLARALERWIGSQTPKTTQRIAYSLAALILIGILANLWLAWTGQRQMADFQDRTEGSLLHSSTPVSLAGQEESPELTETEKAQLTANALTILARIQTTRDGSQMGQKTAFPTLIGIGHEFSGADFSGVSLEGVDLTNGKFPKARFHYANFKATQAPRADFSNSGMRFSTLDQANFSQANLETCYAPLLSAVEADFSQANLSQAHFSLSDFRGSNFQGADLSDTSLAFCDLRGCDFRGADLTGTYLTGAILNDSLFEGAIVSETDFLGATIEGVLFTEEQRQGACRHTFPYAVTQAGVMKLQVTIFEEWDSSKFASGYQTEEVYQLLEGLVGFADKSLPHRSPRSTYFSHAEDMGNLHANIKREVVEHAGRRKELRTRVWQHYVKIRDLTREGKKLLGHSPQIE